MLVVSTFEVIHNTTTTVSKALLLLIVIPLIILFICDLSYFVYLELKKQTYKGVGVENEVEAGTQHNQVKAKQGNIVGSGKIYMR